MVGRGRCLVPSRRDSRVRRCRRHGTNSWSISTNCVRPRRAVHTRVTSGRGRRVANSSMTFMRSISQSKVRLVDKKTHFVVVGASRRADTPTSENWTTHQVAVTQNERRDVITSQNIDRATKLLRSAMSDMGLRSAWSTRRTQTSGDQVKRSGEILWPSAGGLIATALTTDDRGQLELLHYWLLTWMTTSWPALDQRIVSTSALHDGTFQSEQNEEWSFSGELHR